PAPAGAAAAVPSGDLSFLLQLRVLVVDDHELNRGLMSGQLRIWGVEHACAEAGQEALAMMQSAHNAGRAFNVALLDFVMPQMDGLELTTNIKRNPDLAHTALIAMTSASQRSAADACVAAGCCTFLMKPLVRPAQ